MIAMNETLFNKDASSELFQSQESKLHTEIDAYSARELLNTSEQDLCDFFTDRYEIAVPELRVDEITVTQDEVSVDVRRDPERFSTNSNKPYFIPGTKITFFVPFSGDEQLFYCQPSTYTFNPPMAQVDQWQLRFAIVVTNHNGHAVRKIFDEQLDNVQSNLKNLRRDAQSFNASLAVKIRQWILARRTKLLHDQGMVAALGFPVIQRANAPLTYAVPDVRRKLPVQRPSATTAPYKPEPIIPDTEYENILRIISNMAHVLERSPATFVGMGEENLRQHLLVQLNGQYEGQATGETFNAQGKTDILIRSDGANVFIAECKFWKGAQAFSETITQLLGYVTWRDTKTALIIFNRNKDFSGVLASVADTVPKHPNYKRTLPTASETTFRYVLHSQTDVNREVIVAVLAFDVPT